MTQRLKTRLGLALAALGAWAAPAIADPVTVITPAPPPPPGERVIVPGNGATVIYPYHVPGTPYREPTVVVPPASAPVVVERQPAIVVTAPRLTGDQRITADVAAQLADDPTISGYIGVSTFDNKVTLQGRTTTTEQAERAATDARSVAGVREVENFLTARVGMM